MYEEEYQGAICLEVPVRPTSGAPGGQPAPEM